MNRGIRTIVKSFGEEQLKYMTNKDLILGTVLIVMKYFCKSL